MAQENQWEAWSNQQAPYRPPARSEVKSLLAERRWSVSNLAYRWGISVEHLSRVIADIDRPAHWNDAFFGLPKLSQASKTIWNKERRKHRPVNRKTTAGNRKASKELLWKEFLEVGTELIVTGEFYGVGAGSRGVVSAIFPDKNEYELTIGGLKFMASTSDIDIAFTETGRVINGA